MPWGSVKLNDGNSMPSIAFGTSGIGNGQTGIDNIGQAVEAGFSHLDTAQSYGTEEEAGSAFRESGLSREEVFITTKWSGRTDVDTAIHNSLNYLGVKYVDLYLIHAPRWAKPDIATAWKAMEKIQADGMAKSIGVSNFDVSQLQELLASAKVKPAVNQIQFHPYVNASTTPLLAFCKAQNIVVEGYSPLAPLTRYPGGAVDTPVNDIAVRMQVTPAQVLLAWQKAKGAVPVTKSTNKTRLQEALDAGDIQLALDDVAAIDIAGAVGPETRGMWDYVRTAVAVAMLIGAACVLSLGSGFLDRYER